MLYSQPHSHFIDRCSPHIPNRNGVLPQVRMFWKLCFSRNESIQSIARNSKRVRNLFRFVMNDMWPEVYGLGRQSTDGFEGGEHYREKFSKHFLLNVCETDFSTFGTKIKFCFCFSFFSAKNLELMSSIDTIDVAIHRFGSGLVLNQKWATMPRMRCT